MSKKFLTPINLPHGNAPDSPGNGDIWTSTDGLYSRINGVTVGPYGIGTARTFYQTSEPESPGVGDIWVDSDRVVYSGNPDDFILKTGGAFTGPVSGISPTLSSHLATKEYVDNNTPEPVDTGFSPFFLGGM
jgi:hypothetical protein